MTRSTQVDGQAVSLIVCAEPRLRSVMHFLPPLLEHNNSCTTGAAGFVRGHPHWELWLDLAEHVQAGIRFSRQHLPQGVPGHLAGDGSAHHELSDDDDDDDGNGSGNETDGLVVPPAASEKKKKKKSGGASRPAKKERKPRPSTAAVPPARAASTVKANLGLWEAAPADGDVHSSQRKIKVVLGASEPEIEAEEKPKPKRKTKKKKKPQSDETEGENMASGGLE